MTAMRNYLNKKGQGIVEYALLLAFIVGIAVALQGVGLKDAVVGVFDDVAMVLAGNSDGLDLSTSEGRHAADLANMKKFGIAMANEFSFSSSVGARNKLDSDGKFVSQKNFSVLYVFADGTADLYVDGDAYTNAFWLSDAISNNDPRAALYLQTLNNAGIDITNKNAMRINSASDGSELQNGYAVVLNKKGATYWSNNNNNFNADTYKTYHTSSNSTSSGNLAQYAEGYNVQTIYNNKISVD